MLNSHDFFLGYVQIKPAIGAGKTVISIAIILKGLEKARSSREAPRKSGATLGKSEICVKSHSISNALIDQFSRRTSSSN